jgi:pimeloyl-ACP methyl ester carboxylesterase
VRATVTSPPFDPRRLRATPDDLPPAVRAALGTPDEWCRTTVAAAGIRWSVLEWGAADARPLLLLHGVTASAGIWWRIGPALAATGRRVLAPDLPGHGHTGQWGGHHRFADNARDVAALVRAAGVHRPDLQVVGHSWGGMTAAALPSVGLLPATLVLLDPPVLAASSLAGMVAANGTYAELKAARAAVAAGNPGWLPADVEAKAEALVQLQPAAARQVLLENGDWDGGLTALAHEAAADVPVWLIRGEEHAGGLVPDAAIPAFEDRIGPEHVLTIADGPHAPQRTHPEATLLALLLALGEPERPSP